MSGFAVVSTLTGVLFVVGAIRAVLTRQFVRRSVRAKARVVSGIDQTVGNHDPASQSAAVTRYVVDIVEPGRRPRRVTMSEAFGGAIAGRLAGDEGTMRVLYDPARPDVVRIDSPWTLYFMPAFFCAPGVLWAGLVACVWATA